MNFPDRDQLRAVRRAMNARQLASRIEADARRLREILTGVCGEPVSADRPSAS